MNNVEEYNLHQQQLAMIKRINAATEANDCCLSLTDWEQSFISSVATALANNGGRALTVKQDAVLQGIWERAR